MFHRRPAPGEPPFVHVGDRVATGAEVGLVEAMKTFTPVVADRAGVIRAVHVEDARVVEYGQALFDLEPEPTAGWGAS
ncbi:biotin carboxyl carrier domain-containing protein [Saccharothrix algeriensis]|uniref:Biotin carboxyl carrier domain-containing protein n=1 Tax=Saccharothrix algeriensis TaxID=173560 RepID=A0A8T8I002_9PSEU|nr:biotin carboxyl carrier protein [Saccharothrix algeriensis]QTR03969.1 biotin carboxyl carrier domain-containing protein [Saccharothrix algeriensis]